MKIEEYKFINSGLYIKFDTYFKHIKLQKLEDNNGSDEKLVELEYDSIELTFSKQKDSITLHTSENCGMVIIIIWELDKEHINYKSYMFVNKDDKIKSKDNEMDRCINKEELLGCGLEYLFKSKVNIDTGSTINKNPQIKCEIKNENIFAEIKRR